MPEQPWLPYYGEIPASISYPDLTLYELFERAAAEYGSHTAVEYLGERVAYRRVKRLVDAAARALWAVGVRSGDRLALILPNMAHAPVLLYAANRLGVVTSFFHAEAGSRLIAQRITDFAPSWMAVTTEHVDGLCRLIADRGVQGIISCSYSDFGRPGKIRTMQLLRRRYNIATGGIRGAAALSPRGPSVSPEHPPLFAWKSFLKLGSTVETPAHRELHGPDRLAMVLFTGGTTGSGEGVMHTDRQLTAVALQSQVQGPVLAGQSVLSAVPLSHGYGVAVSVHATLAAGAMSILVPHTTPRSLARVYRRLRPEYLIGVPSTYADLVLDRVFRTTRHRALMGAFCGGERLPRAVRELFERIVRRRGGAVSIREGYGLTETVTACATMPDGEERSGSVGIPYPDTEIAIARPVPGTPDLSEVPPAFVPYGTLGEILVSGPTVMSGYLEGEDATARVLHPDGEQRVWLRTGDLGWMDADGFLYFVERIGRAVAHGEPTVHPGITERAINDHLEVLEACVTLEHGATGVSLTAHVTPIDTDRDERWLEEHLRDSLQTLEPHQQPVRYAFHERLPRTPAGLIDHHRLGALQRGSDETVA
ncbi:MAG: class I adenylate-forming enzyme family protein [Spirochaetota bacterium]